MELRRLTTDRERGIFASRVAAARAKHGVGIRDAARSRLSEAHMAFANLYALFEKEDDPPECMMSGFSMHDLEMLPQTYPKPDLTHLPPGSVHEWGDFWSMAKGGGLIARYCAAMVCNILDVRAALIYTVVKPWDVAQSFARSDFEKACEPFEFPYAETLDGGKVWVQAMLLHGDNLQKWMRLIALASFQVLDSGRRIRFQNPFPIQPSLDKPKFSLDESPQARTGAANGHGEQTEPSY